MERGLRFVAAVIIPIDPGETAKAVDRAAVMDGDHCVGKEAKPHAQIDKRVMAGRADQRDGVGDSAAPPLSPQSRQRGGNALALPPLSLIALIWAIWARARKRASSSVVGRSMRAIRRCDRPETPSRFFIRRLVSGFSACSPGWTDRRDG